jgi:D-beta-D-heptose 7-phosphate kinase / D-beta-D-heptose 1-phosphate adenosyltransferase
VKVWVNGCFDVLHHGHFKLLNYAAELGDYLVVGIDTNLRVRELKGDSRPYHTEDERRYNLLSIKGVRKVVMFGTDADLEWHIKNEAPDIMVIGSDYKNKSIIGKEFIPKIVYFDRLNNFSTTNILE